MNLQKATVWAMIGISFIFSSRTFATLAPKLFSDPALAKANALLLLLASLMPLLFYYYFYKEYFSSVNDSLSEKQKMLKNAAIFAFIGSLALTLLLLKGFLQFSKTLGLPIDYGYFEIFAPWINAIFALFFYYAFYQSENKQVSDRLRQATWIAMIGAGLAVLLQSCLLVEFVVHGNFRWLRIRFGSPILFLPLYLFLFFSGFYFLWCLYSELGKDARFVEEDDI